MTKQILWAPVILSAAAGLQCSPDNRDLDQSHRNLNQTSPSEIPHLGYEFSEQFIIDADDPLLLIYEARLVNLLRAMRTKESIDLLLGPGSEITPGRGRITYKLIPYLESAEMESKFDPFVEQVVVDYDEEGVLTSILVLDPSPEQNIGSKQSGFWESGLSE